MKQGRIVITLTMLLFAAALGIYFGFHVYDTLHDPFTTTLTYAYTEDESVPVTGLLVREEQVLEVPGGIVDVVLGEAEKVGVGQTVALVYRDARAREEQLELEDVEREIRVLENAMTESVSPDSAARLDEAVLQSVALLRADSALDRYGELEERVLDIKSGVLRRGYTYGDTDVAAALSARLRELKHRRGQLQAQTAQAVSRVDARQAGVFSSLVDGYEGLLTPETAAKLTPGGLAELLDAEPGVPAALGKLIRDDTWYFAAALPQEDAKRLVRGESARVRFSGDFAQDVDMKVEQVSAPDNGQCVALFSSDRYLSRTTLLREHTAQLIFRSDSGLRVPKQAVHMEKITHVDEQTGQESQQSHLGVYALVAGRAEFKQVEVVAEGSDYYVVRPAASGSRALRAGDEIIVRAVDLYDRKLLEF